jgi:NADPH-dependent ferric siderophore reductase
MVVSSLSPSTQAIPPGLLKQPGRLERAMLTWFARQASVTAIQELAPGFRKITLAGDALKSAAWSPGQKVQLQLGSFVQRTFTPITWDRDAGSTEIVVYLHGDTPSGTWASGLVVGAVCQIFGPRSSLDLTALQRPALLFGDETSFGLGYSLRAMAAGTSASLLFEVTSVEQSSAALAALGIRDATLIARQPDDTHLAEVETALLPATKGYPTSQVILTGKAPSIQRIGRFLKSNEIASARIKAKAYWAPGKAGLD